MSWVIFEANIQYIYIVFFGFLYYEGFEHGPTFLVWGRNKGNAYEWPTSSTSTMELGYCKECCWKTCYCTYWQCGNSEFFLRTKKWPAQKMNKVSNMDVKREVSPTKNLLGKSEPKSCSWHLDVVTENQRAIAKIWSVVFLVPPGTTADVVKATVAMRVATTRHELAFLASHCPPFRTRSSCSCEKICFIVWYCHKKQSI